MDSFELGEHVSILDEKGVFTVKEIFINKLTLEDEFGFEQTIETRFVVKRRQIEVDRIQEKEETKNQHLKVVQKFPSIPQIDLHIENLLSMDSAMSAHAKFSFQIEQFKFFTNQMIQKKVNKFRVIHGMGEGKLKSEIRSLIQNRNGFTMHDDQIANGRVGASIIEMQVTKVTPFT
jgi:hypothetical protein